MAIIQTGLWMSLIESIEITEDWSVMMFLTSGQRKIQDKKPCHRFATYWKNKLTSDRDDSDDDDDDDAESTCERWPCCTKSFLTIHRRVDRKNTEKRVQNFPCALVGSLMVWGWESVLFHFPINSSPSFVMFNACLLGPTMGGNPKPQKLSRDYTEQWKLVPRWQWVRLVNSVEPTPCSAGLT